MQSSFVYYFLLSSSPGWKQKEQNQKLTTHLTPLPSPDMNESLQAPLSDFFIPEQE